MSEEETNKYLELSNEVEKLREKYGLTLLEFWGALEHIIFVRRINVWMSAIKTYQWRRKKHESKADGKNPGEPRVTTRRARKENKSNQRISASA